MTAPSDVLSAEIVLPAPDFAATQRFFCDRLGFRMNVIFPADDPAVATLEGYGLNLRLERESVAAPGLIRLLADDPGTVAGGETELVAPNGTRIEIRAANPPVEIPALIPELIVQKMDGTGGFGEGRAGMGYRDLIPGRLGGRFIASHIRIEQGGPVPDHVHFHRVRFQMIYCYKGWVRLAYQDQGEPFVMKAGDCVLQPPEIRHRVLESSAGLEVIEIGCPAEHPTHLDHAMDLPNGPATPGLAYGGQEFVWHQADRVPYAPWHQPGFEARDIGIEAATDGLAGARVVRPIAATELAGRHDAELVFWFVLTGGVDLTPDDEAPVALAAGDSFTVPAGMAHRLSGFSEDLELLEVALPSNYLIDRL